MTPQEVVRIVQRRNDAAFVNLLGEADPEFADAAFEPAFADALRADPGSASVTQHRHVHPDAATAVADFVRRMAEWLAQREVIAVET